MDCRTAAALLGRKKTRKIGYHIKTLNELASAHLDENGEPTYTLTESNHAIWADNVFLAAKTLKKPKP